MDYNKKEQPYHTEEELRKAGFGGVFGNPIFEVEEVEE